MCGNGAGRGWHQGAIISTYNIRPDIGIAIDVTHGETPDAAKEDTHAMDKGVVVCKGPNMHPGLTEKFWIQQRNTVWIVRLNRFPADGNRCPFHTDFTGRSSHHFTGAAAALHAYHGGNPKPGSY